MLGFKDVLDVLEQMNKCLSEALSVSGKCQPKFFSECCHNIPSVVPPVARVLGSVFLPIFVLKKTKKHLRLNTKLILAFPVLHKGHVTLMEPDVTGNAAIQEISFGTLNGSCAVVNFPDTEHDG